MINIFGVYKDGKDYTKELIDRKISDETESKINEVKTEANSYVKKSESIILNIVGSFLIFLGLPFIFGILGSKQGAEKAMEEQGHFMYIGLGLVIIGGLILLFRHLKVKKTKEDETEDKLNIKVEHLLKECYEQLNIPIDALKIDIISTKYHTNKKGEHKFANQNLFIPINEETSWFIEEDSLFIADLISVIKIPLNSIKALKEIDKRILLRQWNKEESFNSEKYKSYKIKPQNAGLFLIAKTYYSLEFNVDNEEYNILVPKYDLNNLLKLLPLKIEV